MGNHLQQTYTPSILYYAYSIPKIMINKIWRYMFRNYTINKERRHIFNQFTEVFVICNSIIRIAKIDDF
jgi:hypothetical protein